MINKLIKTINNFYVYSAINNIIMTKQLNNALRAMFKIVKYMNKNRINVKNAKINIILIIRIASNK